MPRQPALRRPQRVQPQSCVPLLGSANGWARQPCLTGFDNEKVIEAPPRCRHAWIGRVRPVVANIIAHQGTGDAERSEEHTSELQSLMRISYAVFCLNKKK